ADIFEVRGMKREARGSDLQPVVMPDRILLGYAGLDRHHRRTLLRFTPAPDKLASEHARFELRLGPQQETAIELVVACSPGEEAFEPAGFDEASTAAATALERFKAGSCRLGASESRFNIWLRRSDSDLHMMTSDLPTGPYPYAGVPWFNTPFGR